MKKTMYQGGVAFSLSALLVEFLNGPGEFSLLIGMLLIGCGAICEEVQKFADKSNYNQQAFAKILTNMCEAQQIMAETAVAQHNAQMHYAGERLDKLIGVLDIHHHKSVKQALDSLGHFATQHERQHDEMLRITSKEMNNQLNYSINLGDQIRALHQLYIDQNAKYEPVPIGKSNERMGVHEQRRAGKECQLNGNGYTMGCNCDPCEKARAKHNDISNHKEKTSDDVIADIERGAAMLRGEEHHSGFFNTGCGIVFSIQYVNPGYLVTWMQDGIAKDDSYSCNQADEYFNGRDWQKCDENGSFIAENFGR